MTKRSKILILGGSSDIGIETTKLFLKNNWEVISHYSKKNSVLDSLVKKEKLLTSFKFDLRNINEFQKHIIKKKNLFLNLDAFVSLTGYLVPAKFENFKIKEFYNHINVNFLSNILATRSILKGMMKRKNGRIVLTSSIGTKFGGGDSTFLYSLSKFNNQFFPSYYKKQAYEKNITINTLQIGLTATKIHKKLKSKNFKNRIKMIPLKRMAKVSEVSNYILKLCSKDNTLLTNSVINISGGE
jgi:3-oxoacyl-[acyl-carrier protein] reductase